MVSKHMRLAALCLSIVVAIAACGETRPYVYKRGEFNRDAEDFNKQPEDRDAVVICYSNLATPPETVFEMANTECGRYHKLARPGGQSFGDCPLATPVEAHFACVKP